uniref:endonuclease domain-containing protein n=1 Tax=Cellvibrio fontiphilus TaxID=1815559 RepID=UPI002B4BF2CB|nr:endonuclease domain-containing protein [Cellvibrio fontiphilus]
MENGKIFNRQKQKPQRQELRGNMPMPEKILWAQIRNQQLGVKFRRQHGIGRYIADFYCAQLKLVIELDGDSHYQNGGQEYDQVRDEFMHALGLTVLRFTNRDVMNNLDGVLAVIKSLTPSQPPPATRPASKAGRSKAKSNPLPTSPCSRGRGRLPV